MLTKLKHAKILSDDLEKDGKATGTYHVGNLKCVATPLFKIEEGQEETGQLRMNKSYWVGPSSQFEHRGTSYDLLYQSPSRELLEMATINSCPVILPGQLPGFILKPRKTFALEDIENHILIWVEQLG